MVAYNFEKILFDIHVSAKNNSEYISERVPSYDILWEKICTKYGHISRNSFEDLIIAKVHDEDEFSKWCDFEQRIADSLGLPVEGTTLGAFPSYGSKVVVEKNKYEWGGMQKALILEKSFVGNYFMLYGVDSTYFMDESEKYTKFYSQTHAFTFSPVNSYKAPFLKLEELVRKEFPGIRIIPGLLIRFFTVNKCGNSVYSLLFNEGFTERIRTIGDLRYGFSDWEV